MKILMPNHFPLQGSGSGIYTLNVALELARAGHQVCVIVPGHKNDLSTPHPSITVQTILFKNDHNKAAELDFNFPCFTTHPDSDTTFYQLSDPQMDAYLQAWRQHLQAAIAAFQPDIIHAHHVWVTAALAHETGIPYIISCHGTDLMGYKAGPRYRELALTGAQNAHAIIAISRQVQAEAMQVYQLPKAKLPLIWNGFGSDHFKILPEITKASVLKEFKLTGSNRPLLSFVGKFTEFKGIDVLLKAAAIYEPLLPGIQTLLVGHGGLWDEMQTRIADLNLQGVHCLGHQDQDTVARIYNAADLSIVPSRIEPFGLVAIEALACGTPVVATNAGGLPDFINESIGALVPVDHHEILAETIVREIKTKSKATKGPRAHRYAFKYFTWKKQVALMIQLYQNALKNTTQAEVPAPQAPMHPH
jgi:glycosyltransferase involved in cell wall biosynthesis